MASICIYGSVARKDFDQLSDLDVLVVSSDAADRQNTALRWKSQGWSVASYTPQRLVKMADAGSLFVQHLKTEGMILQDDGGVLKSLFQSYEPRRDYRYDIEQSLQAMELLERYPSSVRLDHWAADVLHVLVRNLGILKLANEGEYAFSMSAIADGLLKIDAIDREDLNTFDELRRLKSSYRAGASAEHGAGLVVEQALRLIERMEGVSIERSSDFDDRRPKFNDPYYNLRAMEKTLLYYDEVCAPRQKGGLVSHHPIWKRILNPRAYSWDIKTQQDAMWRTVLGVMVGIHSVALPSTNKSERRLVV